MIVQVMHLVHHADDLLEGKGRAPEKRGIYGRVK